MIWNAPMSVRTHAANASPPAAQPEIGGSPRPAGSFW